jgi:hypothetical protein
VWTDRQTDRQQELLQILFTYFVLLSFKICHSIISWLHISMWIHSEFNIVSELSSNLLIQVSKRELDKNWLVLMYKGNNWSERAAGHYKHQREEKTTLV